MAHIYDCRDEFIIRQRINFVKRSLRDLGNHNIGVTVMPDANSDVGVSVVIVDNNSGASRTLDPSVYMAVSDIIRECNAKSTFG